MAGAYSDFSARTGLGLHWKDLQSCSILPIREHKRRQPRGVTAAIPCSSTTHAAGYQRAYAWRGLSASVIANKSSLEDL